MRDDPSRNLKWLERELLAEEEVFQFSKAPAKAEPAEADEDLLRRADTFLVEEDDLLERVDRLLEEDEEEWEEEEAPVRNFANNYGRLQKAERVQKAHVPKFDESAAMPVKTKKQLKKEAKQRKIAEKKASVNRNIKGLVFLAFLECLGILAVMGWWLQWLI